MDTLGFSELPPPSHNTGQAQSSDDLRAQLETRYCDLCDRANDLALAEGRLPTLDDDESAGKISDYIKQIMAACKNAESARVSEKEPHLAMSRAVDGFFTKGLVDPLMALKRRVESKLTRYLQEKAAKEREERSRQERAAREAEERARAEALALARKAETDAALDKAIAAEETATQASAARIVAQAAANAKPAELSRTRGDYGSVASLRTNWDYEIQDLASVPRAYMMVNDAALKAHIKARLKDQPPVNIPGVRFYEKTAAAVR